jgi:hypothetical protein
MTTHTLPYNDITQLAVLAPTQAVPGLRFIISLGSKRGHLWKRYNPSEHSIHINGTVGPILHLHRGKTYYFQVDGGSDCSDLHLILTASPAGGPEAIPIPEAFPPLRKGVAILTITEHTPRFFFYQNLKVPFQGGLVLVH